MAVLQLWNHSVPSQEVCSLLDLRAQFIYDNFCRLTVLCETKRNGTLRNGSLRNGTLRNDTLRNGTLRNDTLRNGTLRNGYNCS